jgi:hypothetical protein
MLTRAQEQSTFCFPDARYAQLYTQAAQLWWLRGFESQRLGSTPGDHARYTLQRAEEAIARP